MNSSIQDSKLNSESTYKKEQSEPMEQQSSPPWKTLNLFGLRFTQASLSEAVDLVVKAAEDRQKGFVVTPNVNMLTLLPFEAELGDLVNQALFSFVDGWPIVWASNKLEKKGLPERVAGSDLFPLICEKAEKQGLSMVLMGAAEGVAEEASRQLLISYPKLKILGAYCPPMEDEFSAKSTNEMLAYCNQRKPDILLLGMGIPKQERWISNNIDNLDIGIALCFGGVIDFAAGKIKRSPKWAVNLGLEWLWRLCMSPSQYWRRTILRFPLFFPMFFKELLIRR